MASRKRVAVLKGGRSLERNISLRSAARCEDALRALDYPVCSIDADLDLVDRLKESGADVALIALHGPGGEDGTVQELLELVGIPYSGSDVGACIRCSDKALAKRELMRHGIATPEFYAFSENAFKQFGAAKALPEIEDRLEFPIVIKPASQGSAIGIKFAANAADVPAALISAFSYDERVILERYVQGRELAISVLDSGNGPQALPIVEAIPLQGTSFDFEARYEIGKTEYRCPAALSDGVTKRAQKTALDAFQALGCSTVARVDMLFDETNDQLSVIEVDTIPGLTETSLLPQAAEASGVTFEKLIELLVENPFRV